MRFCSSSLRMSWPANVIGGRFLSFHHAKFGRKIKSRHMTMNLHIPNLYPGIPFLETVLVDLRDLDAATGYLTGPNACRYAVLSDSCVSSVYAIYFISYLVVTGWCLCCTKIETRKNPTENRTRALKFGSNAILSRSAVPPNSIRTGEKIDVKFELPESECVYRLLIVWLSNSMVRMGIWAPHGLGKYQLRLAA